MAHVLHLVKDPRLPIARETIRRQVEDPDTRVTVVLLPQAPAAALPPADRVYRLGAPPAGEEASPYPTITHDQLLDLLFEADTVVAW